MITVQIRVELHPYTVETPVRFDAGELERWGQMALEYKAIRYRTPNDGGFPGPYFYFESFGTELPALENFRWNWEEEGKSCV